MSEAWIPYVRAVLLDQISKDGNYVYADAKCTMYWQPVVDQTSGWLTDQLKAEVTLWDGVMAFYGGTFLLPSPIPVSDFNAYLMDLDVSTGVRHVNPCCLAPEEGSSSLISSALKGSRKASSSSQFFDSAFVEQPVQYQPSASASKVQEPTEAQGPNASISILDSICPNGRVVASAKGRVAVASSAHMYSDGQLVPIAPQSVESAKNFEKDLHHGATSIIHEVLSNDQVVASAKSSKPILSSGFIYCDGQLVPVTEGDIVGARRGFQKKASSLRINATLRSLKDLGPQTAQTPGFSLESALPTKSTPATSAAPTPVFLPMVPTVPGEPSKTFNALGVANKQKEIDNDENYISEFLNVEVSLRQRKCWYDVQNRQESEDMVPMLYTPMPALTSTSGLILPDQMVLRSTVSCCRINKAVSLAKEVAALPSFNVSPKNLSRGCYALDVSPKHFPTRRNDIEDFLDLATIAETKQRPTSPSLLDRPPQNYNAVDVEIAFDESGKLGLVPVASDNSEFSNDDDRIQGYLDHISEQYDAAYPAINIKDINLDVMFGQAATELDDEKDFVLEPRPLLSEAPDSAAILCKLMGIEQTRKSAAPSNGNSERRWIRPVDHYNLLGYPVHHRSSTPSAVSFWAMLASDYKKPIRDGASWKAVVSAQAAKLVDPCILQSNQTIPESLKEKGVATKLRNHLTGLTTVCYEPWGAWYNDQYDRDEEIPEVINSGVREILEKDWTDHHGYPGLQRPYFVEYDLDVIGGIAYGGPYGCSGLDRKKASRKLGTCESSPLRHPIGFADDDEGSDEDNNVSEVEMIIDTDTGVELEASIESSKVEGSTTMIEASTAQGRQRVSGPDTLESCPPQILDSPDRPETGSNQSALLNTDAETIISEGDDAENQAYADHSVAPISLWAENEDEELVVTGMEEDVVGLETDSEGSTSETSHQSSAADDTEPVDIYIESQQVMNALKAQGPPSGRIYTDDDEDESFVSVENPYWEAEKLADHTDTWAKRPDPAAHPRAAELDRWADAPLLEASVHAPADSGDTVTTETEPHISAYLARWSGEPVNTITIGWSENEDWDQQFAFDEGEQYSRSPDPGMSFDLDADDASIADEAESDTDPGSPEQIRDGRYASPSKIWNSRLDQPHTPPQSPSKGDSESWEVGDDGEYHTPSKSHQEGSPLAGDDILSAEVLEVLVNCGNRPSHATSISGKSFDENDVFKIEDRHPSPQFDDDQNLEDKHATVGAQAQSKANDAKLSTVEEGGSETDSTPIKPKRPFAMFKTRRTSQAMQSFPNFQLRRKVSNQSAMSDEEWQEYALEIYDQQQKKREGMTTSWDPELQEHVHVPGCAKTTQILAQDSVDEDTKRATDTCLEMAENNEFETTKQSSQKTSPTHLRESSGSAIPVQSAPSTPAECVLFNDNFVEENSEAELPNALILKPSAEEETVAENESTHDTSTSEQVAVPPSTPEAFKPALSQASRMITAGDVLEAEASIDLPIGVALAAGDVLEAENNIEYDDVLEIPDDRPNFPRAFYGDFSIAVGHAAFGLGKWAVRKLWCQD
ncbi:hypothetical protein P7C71_g4722, partial [Lecanoromycetidae sp. Uapishka_2]